MNVVPVALLVAIGFAADATTAMAAGPGRSDPAAAYDLKIAPQQLGAALQELARQSGSQIIFFSRVTDGLVTKGLEGSHTLPKAIELLLVDSRLTFRRIGERTFEVLPMSRAEPGAARRNYPASAEALEGFQKGIPEILVTGMRGNLNLDVERTESDVLPYVVFDREEIRNASTDSVEDFLKYKLPMNALQQTYSQSIGNVFGARSQADLRGFGTNQTLILIDGRRTSNSVINGSLTQQDLNGIALAAIERIEVLPTSASGIYGGDATGGVINIVLRRDQRGLELAAGYQNVFDRDARKLTASLTGGFNLEGGRTNVSASAFWSDANNLLRRHRGFIQRYRDQAFANRPELWLPPAIVPLGYTTNIRSTGDNLTLDDGTPLNSLFTHVPVGYAGPSSDGGHALVANAGRYNFDGADSSQNPGASIGGRVSLFDSPSLESINVMVRREFGSGIQGFLEASASNSVGLASTNGINSRFLLPADASNNPFQQDIELLVPVPSQDFARSTRSSDRRLVAGVISALPWDWKGELDYVWHESGSRMVFPQYQRAGTGVALESAVSSDPDFNPVRDTNIHRLDFAPYMTDLHYGPFETTTTDMTLLLGGPVGNLPGGRPAFSIRLEHRDENFGGGTFSRGDVPVLSFPEKSQTVRSVVAELRIPLFSANHSSALARELEMQLSARRDDYSIHGSPGQLDVNSSTPIVTATTRLHSTNPTVGLRWMPTDDVTLRASYGTGFLPPNVTQLTPLAPSPGSSPSALIDPRRGNRPIGAPITVQTGGNPGLTSEKSESLSMGLIYTPRWAKGMRLSVDHTRIDRTERIAGHPFALQGLIGDEAIFPDRVVRGTPTPAEAAMGWPGPITFIDFTLLNIANAGSEAVDLQLDYNLPEERLGKLAFHVLGTWNVRNESQTKEGEPVIDNVGFWGGVLDYKFSAGLTWKWRGLTLGWNTQYFDSYFAYPAFAAPLTAPQIASRARAVQTQGSEKVDSQMYHDAFARYRFERFDGSEITLGIRNVLNTRPPRDLQSYSTYGDPRLASYHLGLRMFLD